MQNITVGRYDETPLEERKKWGENVREFADDWQGWIEPEDKSWIVFIDKKGRPVLYAHRDKKGGVTSQPLFEKEDFK